MLTKALKDLLLKFNTDLTELRQKLVISKTKTVNWQAGLDQSRIIASQKALLLGQIKMSTNNLFRILQSREKRAEGTSDTMTQLEDICQFVVHLKSICAELRSSKD